MQKLPILVAALAIASLCAQPAEARVFEGGITHDEMKNVLIDAGFSALTVVAEKSEPGAVPDLVIMGGPARWYVHFMACKDGRCADLHLDAGFDLDAPVAASVVAALNHSMLGRLTGNVYLDDEGDPILQADVNTDGVSGNNIRYSIRAFDLLMRCVALRIDFDDTAGACDGLEDRLVAIANQGLAAEDVTQVIAAVGPVELERILRDNGYEPVRNAPDSGLVSFTVKHDGIRWTAAVPEDRAGQINGSIFLLTGCVTCAGDRVRRANAYNAERRWLSAEAQEGLIVASTTLPLSGGVTEDSIGMMIRSFHSWARNFESEVSK